MQLFTVRKWDPTVIHAKFCVPYTNTNSCDRRHILQIYFGNF